MTTKNVRPKFLNLFGIHQPVTAVVSIAHRASGALLVLALPFVVFLFSHSLQSEQGFERVSTILQQGWLRLLALLVLWSLLFHLLSGIRFLLLDLDIGIRLPLARGSAWAVLGLALLLAVLLLAGAIV